MIATVLGVLTLAIWIYLALGRGFFWRISAGKPPALTRSDRTIAVVIPARNEAEVIGRAIASLHAQTYPGSVRLFVVDDHSSDGTKEAAREATVIESEALPPGWTGKLWALAQGVVRASESKPDYFLFTDADIVHAPDNLASLVARAESYGLDLVSLMVKLHCKSFAEKLLIPPFVFFFFKLYPPAWIADLEARTAGAAGGCILIRPEALRRIGGLAAIRGELIDDCALAREVKRGGPIWLGVTETTHSIRTYSTFAQIGSMISRTAFTQLRHSTVLLIGTVVGLTVTYLMPPALAFTGPGLAAHLLGLAAWLVMMALYLPTLRLYRRSPAWALVLPLAALSYLGATIHSAFASWSGKGGMWKGRAQDRISVTRT